MVTDKDKSIKQMIGVLQQSIQDNHEEYTKRLSKIEDQTTKTNGRVTAIELDLAEKKAAAAAVAQYIKDNPVALSEENRGVLSDKLIRIILALIAVITAIVGTLTIVVDK